MKWFLSFESIAISEGIRLQSSLVNQLWKYKGGWGTHEAWRFMIFVSFFFWNRKLVMVQDLGLLRRGQLGNSEALWGLFPGWKVIDILIFHQKVKKGLCSEVKCAFLCFSIIIEQKDFKILNKFLNYHSTTLRVCLSWVNIRLISSRL